MRSSFKIPFIPKIKVYKNTQTYCRGEEAPDRNKDGIEALKREQSRHENRGAEKLNKFVA